MTDIGKTDSSISVLKHFFIETVVGILLFMMIALAAWGLNAWVNYLVVLKVDSIIIYGLTFAEYLLFLFDLILFCRFLWSTGLKTWRHL